MRRAARTTPVCSNTSTMPNTLYYGDNLAVLRDHVVAEFVGHRLGGSERRRSHLLIYAAHQTSELALDGLVSWFESRQVGLIEGAHV